MLLMIDNYDSFTYNLVQYFGELGEEVHTIRNDEITLAEISAMKPDRICISPGPKTPAEAGVSVDILREFKGKLPILGVCLGHQAIGAAFGGNVIRAKQVMHGKTSLIAHTGVGVFKDLPSPFTVIRYHSLAIERCVAAGLPGSDGMDRRRRDHGRAAQGVRHRGRAVPPRVDPVRTWPQAAAELPRTLTPTGNRHEDHPTRSPAALHRTPRDFPRRDAAPVPPDHVGRDVADHDRGAHHRPAREEGNHRRDRRRRPGDARVLDQGADGRHHQPARHRRHRRRRRAHLQHLDGVDVRRRGGRRARGQARRAQRVVVVRQRRRDRVAGRQHQPETGADRAVDRADRHRLHVRAEPPRGDEARGAGAARTGRAHDLQHPRAR